MPPHLQALLGIAWYRAEQWPDLLAAVSDRSEFEERHEDWLATAEKTLEDMTRAGSRVERVEVDVTEMVAWCRARKAPLDARARSRFVSEKLQARHKPAKGEAP